MNGIGRTGWWVIVSFAAGGACVPEPEPPPPETFPEPAQPSLRPADDAEVIVAWGFEDCKTDWTVETRAGTAWACGRIVRGPGGDRTGEGSGWGVGMSASPAILTESSLVSPAFLLDGGAGNTFTLSVWHWLDADGRPGPRDSGGGLLEVYDPATKLWVARAPIGGYDGRVIAPGTSIDRKDGFTDAKVERTWRRSFFDLSPWAGSSIRVRLHAALGTLTPGDGWFLDDVQVFRGGVVEDVIDTDLSTCGAGEVIRFPFRTCDEGFGASGTRSSWACGPATPVAGYDDAPVGDGPQFDVDDTGLLFATAPSGLYYALETSALVSPPMDLSGCIGRSTSLSFWHWYHFAPGAGGLVEVWDGKTWNEAEPIRGYGGPIEAARRTLGRAPDGFVTPDDRGSGWRFEVFDVSDYVNPQFRVRFRFFAGLQRRPGWYVDTVAVSTFALEDLPRLDGDPKLPGCGFGATDYAQPDFNADVPDPCVAGEVLLPGKTVFLNGQEQKPAGGTTLVPGGDGFVPDLGIARTAAPDGIVSPVEEVMEFDVVSDGAICLVIGNGTKQKATRVAAGNVALDEAEIISSGRFNSMSTVLRQRSAVKAGRHKIAITASGPVVDGEQPVDGAPAPHRFYTYEVLFQAGNAMPAEFSSPVATGGVGGTAVRLANLATARHGRSRIGRFEMEARLAAVGAGPQAYVAPYVMQIADRRTCRQVREVRGFVPIRTASAGGMEEALATVGFGWDGQDDRRAPTPAGQVFVRFFATGGMAGLNLFPLPKSPPSPPPPGRGGGGPRPPFDRVTGPPSLDLLKTPPYLVRLDLVRTTPRISGFCRSAEACGAEWRSSDPGPPSVTWSCAPNAEWAQPGFEFHADQRALCLNGVFPRAGTYDVVISQGLVSWRQRFVFDDPAGFGFGWWLEATLPAVGDTPDVPVAGPATVVVTRDSVPMTAEPIRFAFRAPRFTRIRRVPPAGGFTRGTDMAVDGHLLATYRVALGMLQESVGGVRRWGPFLPTSADGLTWDEPVPGALTSTYNDSWFTLRVPDTVDVGPACLHPVAAAGGTTIIGGRECFDIVPLVPPDLEHDPFEGGERDECEPFSGLLHDGWRDPWGVEGPVEPSYCPLGCVDPREPYFAFCNRPGTQCAWDGWRLGFRAACFCSDSDFGNPFESGRFGADATGDDRCEGDVLVEIVPPASCAGGAAGVQTRIDCEHGCADGACNCAPGKSPIIFGCLPYDWPVPPARERAAYGGVFNAACGQQVARFAAASGLNDQRCYRVKPMWFPEHWAEHNFPDERLYFVGSDPTEDNQSWPRRALNDLLIGRAYDYWLPAIGRAVSAGCSGADAYLCDYADVEVFVLLAAWKWTESEMGSLQGIGVIEGTRPNPMTITLPKWVPHEVAHIMGWNETPSGGEEVRHLLCEEYSRTAYDRQDEESAITCDNTRPPSRSVVGGERDGTCEMDTSFDPPWSTGEGCMGAPLIPGTADSDDPNDHCFMGTGQGGFCGYCRAHLREAFPRWL